MTYGVGPYAKLPYSVPLEIIESGGGGGGVTVIPGGLQFLDRQFATVIAARLGGVIQ